MTTANSTVRERDPFCQSALADPSSAVRRSAPSSLPRNCGARSPNALRLQAPRPSRACTRRPLPVLTSSCATNDRVERISCARSWQRGCAAQMLVRGANACRRLRCGSHEVCCGISSAKRVRWRQAALARACAQRIAGQQALPSRVCCGDSSPGALLHHPVYAPVAL